MATLTLGSTTTYRAAVARHSTRLRELFRAALSRTKPRRHSEYEYSRHVAKAVLSSDRSKALEHVVALVIDLAQRGHLEDATSIGEQLIAIARVEHAAVNQQPDAPQLSVDEAHLAEEYAEGAVEVAETALARNPHSLSHALAYLNAAATHTRTRRELDAAVRREFANQ